MANRWISSGAKCVETVFGNVGHGTRLNMGTCGYWFVLDLNLVASVTVLLAETWRSAHTLTAVLWFESFHHTVSQEKW